MSRLGGWLVIEMVKLQYYLIVLGALFFALSTFTESIVVGGARRIIFGVFLSFFTFVLPVLWGRVLCESILSIIQVRDRMDIVKHRVLENQRMEPINVMSSPIVAWVLSDSHGSRPLEPVPVPVQEEDRVRFTIVDDEDADESAATTRTAEPSRNFSQEVASMEVTQPPPRRERRSMSVSDVYRPELRHHISTPRVRTGGETSPLVHVSSQSAGATATSTENNDFEADWPPSPPPTPTNTLTSTPETGFHQAQLRERSPCVGRVPLREGESVTGESVTAERLAEKPIGSG